VKIYVKKLVPCLNAYPSWHWRQNLCICGFAKVLWGVPSLDEFHWRTLNPPFKVGSIGQIYLGKIAGIFLFLANNFFANSEFIFAIKDPKLAMRGLEHILDTAQNRELLFTFTLEN